MYGFIQKTSVDSRSYTLVIQMKNIVVPVADILSNVMTDTQSNVADVIIHYGFK